jgi:hypothetical protein
MIYISSQIKKSTTAQYSIYSMLGQVVKSGSLNLNGTESISISDIAPGVYEIKFIANDKKSTYKFVKE